MNMKMRWMVKYKKQTAMRVNVSGNLENQFLIDFQSIPTQFLIDSKLIQNKFFYCIDLLIL